MSSAERAETKVSSGENQTFLEIKRKLEKIEDTLARQGASCTVEIFGVIHDFQPGAALLRKIIQPDIVTLELTRNVVHAGLEGGESQVLGNNVFWREVVQALRVRREGKLIRGIEVNQTARVGWKRFSLHHGHNTLGSALFTVEAGEELPDEIISLFLRPEQIAELRKYRWLMIKDIYACEKVSGLAVAALERPDFSGTWPISLGNDLSLVAARMNERKIPNFLVTFMLPPRPSLEEARQEIEIKIRDSFPDLSEKEAKLFSIIAMENILLSPAELTDAREIVYALSQFIKQGLSWPTIRCLHIGGAGHLSVIADILETHLPLGSQRIRIYRSSDPRFRPYQGGIHSFWREKVPFPNLVSIVDVKGFEVTANPQMAAGQAQQAITQNREDFWRKVLIWRILEKRYSGKKGRKAFNQELQDQYELCEKGVRELEQIATP